MITDRIKEILAQCTYDVLGVKQIDQAKFADLMVKDCQQTLINNGYDDAAQCLNDVYFGLSDAP